MLIDPDHIKTVYSLFDAKHKEAREQFGKPLTLAEKILTGHMKSVNDEDGKPLVRKKSYAQLHVDRVAMQDATAQMALLQFINAGKKQAAVPSTVHCDHLIRAQVGAKKDLEEALESHGEVFDFLKSCSAKYGIGFWKPGSGIIHQVVFENYAFPGGMMIGTDSHTPNAGGLGMIAIGVGGADAVDVLSGLPFVIKWPGVIGVKLTGKLSGWTAPKDVILKLMGILTVKGGTGHIVEFFGDGCKTISATGKATITNMGAEHGATTSVFPYDSTMADFLRASDRAEIAEIADENAGLLCADPEVYAEPDKFYDRVVEIDLSALEPHWVGPHSPDKTHLVSEMAQDVQKENYPNVPKAALLGSCTNSSYEDIGRSASLASFATENGLSAKIPFLITPGSETVHSTIKRDGQMETLEKMGGTVLANACGPCIGQWKRTDSKEGEENTIVSSYNRNFPGRNDGNRATLSFIGSPEMVTAVALAGRLDFNPITDTLENAQGESVTLPTPQAKALPDEGLSINNEGLIEPPQNGDELTVEVKPGSDRLALLEPFQAFDQKEFKSMQVLAKAKGKCTTDHISMAGTWLRFRGHLDKISDNTYIGLVGAFGDATGQTKNQIDPNKAAGSIPEVARAYKSAGKSWLVIGDENFGEGSSREHAAMQPRHLGGKAIIVRSFARIHESNLKKHGMLPLTFKDPADYEKILEGDTLEILGLSDLGPGKALDVVITHTDNSRETIVCEHTMSAEQVKWLKAGSALNYLAELEKEREESKPEEV